jgi:hypothetical protein
VTSERFSQKVDDLTVASPPVNSASRSDDGTRSASALTFTIDDARSHIAHVCYPLIGRACRLLALLGEVASGRTALA